MEIFYSKNILGNTIVLSKSESAHCCRVLRRKIGDVINICDGCGNLYSCTILEDNPNGVVAVINSTQENFGEHHYYLHMAVAPTKNIDRFEWFVEKATEMGVDRITPIYCEHSERKNIKVEREERVILSAVKQSLKGKIPHFDDYTDFKKIIAQTSDFDGIKLIAHCSGNRPDRVFINDRIQLNNSPSRILILIGPEGDFSDKEIDIAIEAGFQSISLGTSRMRTETAAVFAVSAVYLNNPIL